MRVLGRTSSINVRKVLWTCDEIGIAYHREDWGAGFKPTDSPEFLSLNPFGLIPVIEDENGILRESNTICRYLVTKSGRTDLLPADPYRRAQVEQWMDWQATDLNGAWNYAFLALVRNNPAYTDPAKIEKSLADWNQQMSLLEQHLSEGGPYITGEEFTLADIVIGLSTHRWRMTPQDDRPDLGAVLEYYELLCGRADFLTWGPNGGA